MPLIIAGGIVFIVLCFFLQKYVFPNGVLPKTTDKSIPEIDAAATVRVSEVMSSNASSIQDDTGAYPDWVEIVNNSGKTVNLYGWKLAKDSSLMIKYFEFPNQTLAAGERVLVYCTGTLRNNAGYAYHAPFRISAAGDTLVLFNPNNIAVQTLNIPEMSANQSYAEIGGEWTVTDEATPGLSNTSESYHLLHDNREVSDSPIEITELMAKNMSYAADENGEFLDWIEIHNKSAYTVSLNNYALSDSDRNLQKWHFPNVSIGPDEYMIVYCSGYDRRDPVGRLHTNFRLSSEKEGAYLSNAAGQLIDFVEYDLLKADQSYSRQSDGTWTTNLSPTPGMSNSFQSAALIDGQFAAQNSSGVFFNEIMATTTTANVGKASYDWIELYNATSQTIDLSSWGLSDNPAKPRKAEKRLETRRQRIRVQRAQVGHFHLSEQLRPLVGEIIPEAGQLKTRTADVRFLNGQRAVLRRNHNLQPQRGHQLFFGNQAYTPILSSAISRSITCATPCPALDGAILKRGEAFFSASCALSIT